MKTRKFTLSIQLINPNLVFCVSRPHRRSTTDSLETNPFVCFRIYARVVVVFPLEGYTGSPRPKEGSFFTLAAIQKDIEGCYYSVLKGCQNTIFN